jgi:Zn-dependent M28 family amino/carboxypeptidase
MRILYSFILTCILATPSLSQPTPPDRNPAVQRIVQEISAESLREIVEKLVSFGTRHTLSDTVSATRGIGAARRWIRSEFERYARASNGRMTVEFHQTIVPPSARVPAPSNVVNVVATLRPKDPGSVAAKRMIVVGGHYDSRAGDPLDAVSDAPGANDDGSGTALVLELARIMSKRDFEATVVFIAFAGEEQGLLGATAWAETAKRNGWNIEAMLNNDIVGSSVGGEGAKEDGYVRLFSEAFSQADTGAVFRSRVMLGHENDGGSRSLARYIKDLAEWYNPGFMVKMVYRLDRFSRGGDHRPFHNLGYPAVRFSVARENYDWQHQDVRKENDKQYGDLIEFMDFPYLTNVARANAAAIATLAWAPAPPKNVGLVSALGYETILRWDRNTEVDLAGYYVSYRETTSPVWQHHVFTTDTTVTLAVPKDEFLFGVQAIDKEANISLTTMPRAVAR